MPNGWLETADNVAAVGSMALSARRLTLRVLSTYGVPAADRRDADYRRDLYLERHDYARHDLVATALSSSLLAAAMVRGEGVTWSERLPKEAAWFAKAAYESLHAMRDCLAEPEVADGVHTSAVHCRSGVLAADLERPDCLYDAVTMLDSWTGYLLAQLDHEQVPAGLCLTDAVAAAGGPPCAIFSEKSGPGFPVIVTAMDITGEAKGFPTVGFRATDLWARRPSWLRGNVIPDAEEATWSTLPARPEVIARSIDDFETRALPAMRHSNAHGMFIGTAGVAEEIGVSTPKLAAWLRQNNMMVPRGDEWVPAPLLGSDTVRSKQDRMGHVSWQWSPAFVEEIRPLAAEIAQTVIARGPARPKPPPTPRQLDLLQRLHQELDIEMPKEGYRSRKTASDAISHLLERREASKAETTPPPRMG